VISDSERWFKDAMMANDFPTSARAFNIRNKKRSLGKAKREISKKVAEIKEERLTEYSTSRSTQENINKTFADLELTAKAHTFAEWCQECGCIHLDEVLTDSHATKRAEEETDQLFSCISCERIPELADVNGLFTEDQVVKFKLKHKGSEIEWGKEMVVCKQCELYINMLGEDKSVLKDPSWKLW